MQDYSVRFKINKNWSSNWVYENEFNIADRVSVALTVFFSSNGINFPKKV